MTIDPFDHLSVSRKKQSLIKDLFVQIAMVAETIGYVHLRLWDSMEQGFVLAIAGQAPEHRKNSRFSQRN